GGQIGAVTLGHFLSAREQFHSNVLGQYVDAGNWKTVERLHGLAAALTPSSAGPDEAQARAAVLLAGQVKAQAFSLAASDAFHLVAWVIAAYLVLVAFLRPSTLSLRNQENPQ